MTRYWAMRTDQSRRSWIWSELQNGRLRQGWGIHPSHNLERLADLSQRGVVFTDFEREVWRGNRRLLPSQPDSMQIGDLVVFLNMPRRGVWSIAQVTGGYRYEVSTQANAWDGSPDYGHIRDVELLTDERGVNPDREGVSDALRRSMRPMSRMWSLDAHWEVIDGLVANLGK